MRKENKNKFYDSFIKYVKFCINAKIKLTNVDEEKLRLFCVVKYNICNAAYSEETVNLYNELIQHGKYLGIDLNSLYGGYINHVYEEYFKLCEIQRYEERIKNIKREIEKIKKSTILFLINNNELPNNINEFEDAYVKPPHYEPQPPYVRK